MSPNPLQAASPGNCQDPQCPLRLSCSGLLSCLDKSNSAGGVAHMAVLIPLLMASAIDFKYLVMTPDVPALSESNTQCLVMAVWTSLYGKEPYALDRSNHRTARSPLFSLTSWMSCVTLLHQRVNVVVAGEEST